MTSSTSLEPIDRIAGLALTGAEALFAEIRARIGDAATGPIYAPQSNLLSAIWKVMNESVPVIVDHLTDTEMASWTGGMDSLAKQLPKWLLSDFMEGRFGQSPPERPRFTLFDMFGDEPKLRFPLIEKAAEKLADRNIMTRSDWDAAERSAQERAFFITGDITRDTIAKVRDELVNDLSDGTSLRTFRERVSDVLERSAIGPARIETIYRTNVQTAFRDGRETLSNHPIVRGLFPYQAYLATHDARTRHEHRALEELGLNGTNVYRTDDPFWDRFTPPIDYNCRCGKQPLTIEAAARKGVREAKEWLETGVAPYQPEWRYQDIPFTPKAGFGSRGRVAA
jgi:SPP1 gp7 family putative phage head morphogenesis protein